jgi:transposase InsO family protein
MAAEAKPEMTLQGMYKMGKEMGFEGQELKDFVRELQDDERARRNERRQWIKEDQEREERMLREERDRQEAIRKEESDRQEAIRKEENDRQEAIRKEEHDREDAIRQKDEAIAKKLSDDKGAELELRRKELELKEKELEQKKEAQNKGAMAKAPKLPVFQTGKDDMDSYLVRFERYAEAQKWAKDNWASCLSALLTGKALEVYYRLDKDEVGDYDTLKEALLKNFQLTEEGFKKKLFTGRAETGETASQFSTRLFNYFDRWIQLSGTKKTYEDVRNLLVRTFFIEACYFNLATYLKEHSDVKFQDLVKLAEVYVQVHGHSSLSVAKKESSSPSGSGPSGSTNASTASDSSTEKRDKKTFVCNKCGRHGHIGPFCRYTVDGKSQESQIENSSRSQPVSNSNTSSNSDKQCYLCHKFGHIARNCRTYSKPAQKSAVMMEMNTSTSSDQEPAFNANSQGNDTQGSSTCQCGRGQAACFITELRAVSSDFRDSTIIRDGRKHVVCYCGAPAVVCQCGTLPTAEGFVNGNQVTLLRDSGCTGVVVRTSCVQEDQYLGQNKLVLMADGTVRKVPVARVFIDSPYYTGEVNAMVMPTPVYDLILGNIQGVRNVGDPDKTWRATNRAYKELRSVATQVQNTEVSAAVTRSQAKQDLIKETKPLRVPDIQIPVSEKQEEFKREQKEDSTLSTIWQHLTQGRSRVRQTRTAESYYEVQKGLLYRIHKRIGNKMVKQLVLPRGRRLTCMKLAHSSIMGGHMGTMKTLNRIMAQFYWPGIQMDVTRYCKSCDICQRTLPKGRVTRAPLMEMPTMDVPFKRVAVDIVGPINPRSENGKKYILTLVDYATRYPEAVAMSNIETVTVAEALLDIYSRVGLPEEILSDMGSQFTSALMREVSRLISVRQLTTTPYHPMANGLVEKFNGTLKTILKRLCAERPKDWDRFLPAVLFAYREVPQDSTGYSPFELLYGRDVRGPLSVLKEIWLKERSEDPEVKTTYQYVLDLRDRIEKTCELAQQELSKSARRYKKYYDRKAKARILQPGDQALLLLPSDHNKLLLQWKGPFKVLDRVGKCDYSIEIKGKPRTFHINMLKQYFKPLSEENLESTAETEISGGMILIETDTEQVTIPLPAGQKESYLDIKYAQDLTPEQLQEVQQLIKEFQDICTDIPGTTWLEEHKIDLTTEDCVKQKPYPVPYAIREVVNKEIQYMLEQGIIEHTDSPYASPIVMVLKKDGTYRLCVDFRRLNIITIFDGEPMPSMTDIFSKLHKDKYFTKMDLSKGFWQIPIRPQDRPKTSFVTTDGKYQFKKMPFGLVNATATFNRLMRKVLLQLDNVDSFVDDVLIHTPTWEEHLTVLKDVLEALKRAGLTIRPSKCNIGYTSLEFLGHNIQHGKVAPQVDKVKDILDAEPPQTKKQVRSFLGLIGFYRSFIPDFATIAAPLTDLTKKGLPNNVTWGPDQQRAFNHLKALLLQEPILRMPDFTQTFYLQTDASDLGVGGVLLQEFKGVKCPIAYFSKKFNQQELKYSVIEKECLAMIWSIQKFEIYLYGREFILETDHKALTFIDQAKTKNARIMRWALFLQNYKFRIVSIKGTDNVVADYLSRTGKS